MWNLKILNRCIVARDIAKINAKMISIKNDDLTRHQWYYFIYLKHAPHRVCISPYLKYLHFLCLNILNGQMENCIWRNAWKICYLIKCFLYIHFKCFLYFTVAIKYVKDYLSSIMQHFSDVIENICSTVVLNTNECSA